MTELDEIVGRPCIRLVEWVEPHLETRGVDPRSQYVECYWLPILGPSRTSFEPQATMDKSPGRAGSSGRQEIQRLVDGDEPATKILESRCDGEFLHRQWWRLSGDLVGDEAKPTASSPPGHVYSGGEEECIYQGVLVFHLSDLRFHVGVLVVRSTGASLRWNPAIRRARQEAVPLRITLRAVQITSGLL